MYLCKGHFIANDGVHAEVIIRSVERCDRMKIKLTGSDTDADFAYDSVAYDLAELEGEAGK